MRRVGLCTFGNSGDVVDISIEKAYGEFLREITADAESDGMAQEDLIVIVEIGGAINAAELERVRDRRAAKRFWTSVEHEFSLAAEVIAKHCSYRWNQPVDTSELFPQIHNDIAKLELPHVRIACGWQEILSVLTETSKISSLNSYSWDGGNGTFRLQLWRE